MASPFPGMNPFLEDPEFWSAVHNRLIVSIADDLVDHLSEKYRVEIEKRTYFSNDDESLLVGIPDVSVVTGRVEATPPTTQSSLSVLPEKVTIPILEEVNERYLEIREVATGTVVTVLEILSPKNKRAGEGRLAYERKRNQVLASATNLVEIDLLRGGKPFPILRSLAEPIASQHLGDYRILICRGNDRPRGDLYAFGLRQPIPTIPIPIVPGEAEPILDLQSLLHRVYDKGRYQLAIDYTSPLQPKLSEVDREWVETLLRH